MAISVRICPLHAAVIHKGVAIFNLPLSPTTGLMSEECQVLYEVHWLPYMTACFQLFPVWVTISIKNIKRISLLTHFADEKQLAVQFIRDLILNTSLHLNEFLGFTKSIILSVFAK